MKYKGKKILIIGGTSGLGKALAKDLKKRGSAVTISSRDAFKIEEHLKSQYKTLSLDITDQKSVDRIPNYFDAIFCCAGFAIPSLADKIEIDKIEEMIKCNFLGPVRVYMHLLKSVSPEKRKGLVFISSTLGLHSFTGYGMYSPSKSALSSFYEAVYDESSLLGLDLYIYYVSTIRSKGFDEEQKIKPEITKRIEGSSINDSALPENRAKRLLDEMKKNRIIYSDFITRLFSKSVEIRSITDVLAYLISPLFWVLFRLFAYHSTAKYYRNRKCK